MRNALIKAFIEREREREREMSLVHTKSVTRFNSSLRASKAQIVMDTIVFRVQHNPPKSSFMISSLLRFSDE